MDEIEEIGKKLQDYIATFDPKTPTKLVKKQYLPLVGLL